MVVLEMCGDMYSCVFFLCFVFDACMVEQMTEYYGSIQYYYCSS